MYVFFMALLLEKFQFCQEVSRYLKKILSTILMEKGHLRAYPAKKYISAGDRVLPFPVFPRTSLQWQYDTR
jgi:hypothetical protein